MSEDVPTEYAWPRLSAQLFVPTGEHYEHAHFAWGGFETTFAGYIMGYKASADTLVESIVGTPDIRRLDTYIFPIMFLYRQYIELEMKSIYLQYSNDDHESKQQVIKEKGHNLLKIWHTIKPLMMEEISANDAESVSTVENYIQQFHQFDKTSTSFRYPVDRNLELIFDGEQRINYVNLKQCIDELESFFNGVDGHLSSVQEFKRDMESYFR